MSPIQSIVAMIKHFIKLSIIPCGFKPDSTDSYAPCTPKPHLSRTRKGCLPCSICLKFVLKCHTHPKWLTQEEGGTVNLGPALDHMFYEQWCSDVQSTGAKHDVNKSKWTILLH